MNPRDPLPQLVRDGWGWTGLDPLEVVAQNPFGNLIVRARDGGFWRIIPEDLSCSKVAPDEPAWAALREDAEFQLDWRMDRLVRLTRSRLGPAPDGHCYCLKIPAVLGGAYDADNFGTIPLPELVAFSGGVARQIKDLPDGTRIEFRFSD